MTKDTIIFDLGGVLLDINYQATSNAFKNLGVTNFDELFSQAKQNHFFDLIETGKISENTFRNELRSLTNLDVSDEMIDDSWNAMLGKLPSEKLAVIKLLSKEYKLFLLSNTNSIHLRKFRQIIDDSLGYNNFKESFSEIYYSHEIGLRKPNTDVFNYVLKRNNLNPEKVLFFDDSKQHLDGAEHVGIQSHLIESNSKLSLEFIKSLMG